MNASTKPIVLVGRIQPTTETPSYSERIASAIDRLRTMPQRECPLIHRFQDGVYLREIFMPADTFVIGHIHKTRHQNIVLSGKAIVMVDGKQKLVQAGNVFESEAGVQKVLYIIEDMRWITVHANPNDECDITKLEESLIEAPEWFLTEKGSRTLDEFRMSINNTLTEFAKGDHQ